MPRLEYEGILARPGPYKYKWGTEIKTFEELKKAFQRKQELTLTLGHPMNPDGTPRIPNKEDYLGRIIPVINEEKQRIDGIFKFHDEEWDKIPPKFQDMLVNDESVAISAGFPPPTMVNGEQQDILYDHYALLVNSENPICPLGECGINVRLESDKGEIEIMRYEQASETKDPEPEDKDEASETPKYVTAEDLDRFKDALLDELRPKAEAGAEPVEEDIGKSDDLPEKSEPEPVPEPVKEKPPEPSLEPERAFPAGKVTGRDIKSEYMDDDGTLKIPSEIYLGGTKKKQ